MTLYGLALAVPLLSVFTYRREERSWRAALGYAALALVLSVTVGIIAAFVFGFGVTIETSLCGADPWQAGAAGVVAYAIVASWASLRTRRVWAWAGAIPAGLALAIFVSYFFARAHAYCET